MNFSLFKNLYSKEASGEISAEQFVNAVRQGAFREQVEYFRQLESSGKKNEAAAAKRNMMAVAFFGVCKLGRSFEKTTERTGLVMLDVDDLTKEQIKAIRRVLEGCPWVVMVFVTVSGYGLRVVVNAGIVDRKDYTRMYVTVGRRLKELTGAEPDMQCKDFARLSVVSFDPDIYYNPKAEVFPYSPDWNNGAPDVERIVDKFFSRYRYVEGSRHGTLLFLGRYLRWCKVERWQLDNAIGKVCSFATGNGMTAKEVEGAMKWGYENGKAAPYVGNQGSLGSAGPQVHYNKGFFCKKQSDGAGGDENDDADEEEIMEYTCKSIPDSVYEKLPDSFRKLISIGKDNSERDILLLSMICMMSGIFSNLRTMYGNRLYSPHLFLAILARAGTGKGLASLPMRLGNAINRKMAQRYAIEKSVYDKKCMEWELEKKIAMKEKRLPNAELCPVPPTRQSLKNPPNMSKSQFMLAMKAAEVFGNIIEAPEIDSVNSALSTEYGKHLPELRMAFQHETIGQYYKVDNEPVIIEHPMLTIDMTGSVEQFMKFVPNIHDGMFSRFLFYLFNGKVVWKSQSPLEDKGDLDAEKIVEELDARLCEYFFEEEGNITMIHFTKEQWDKHKAVFSELLNMVMSECEEGLEAVVTRGGLITMRIAMVFCGVRIMESGWKTRSYICSDEDFEAAMEIVAICIRHSIQLSTIYTDNNRRKKMEGFFRKLKVLRSMGDLFSYTEFVDKGKSMGFSRSAMKRCLNRYLEAGILERVASKYRKLKSLRDDLYDDGICKDKS